MRRGKERLKKHIKHERKTEEGEKERERERELLHIYITIGVNCDWEGSWFVCREEG